MLSKMTPLSEIVQELNKLSSFKQCTAIEYEGILCFNNIKCKNLCEKHYKRLKTIYVQKIYFRSSVFCFSF